MDEGDLVGRDRELERLRHWIAAGARGRGSFVLLAGEPGIGKTSLAMAMSDAARSSGCAVAWGSCRETPGAPPYWPWLQILRDLPEAAGEQLSSLLPASTPGEEKETDRFRLFDSVSRALTTTAARHPLLLVLDDLHRADEASIGLLRFLVTSIVDDPMIVVGTYRASEVDAAHPLGRLIGEISGLRVLDLIQLHGLSREETERLAHLKGVRLDDDGIAVLQDRTGGNPFFLTELLQHTPRDITSVPLSIGAAIRAHVAQLPRATQELLFLAAVLGREVRPDVLVAATGTAPDDVSAALWPAVEAGLVEPRAEPPGTYQFRHALVQQSLYASLDHERRLELHELAVTTLSRLVGDDPLHATDLAHHALEAVARPGGRDRAIDLARQAARVAEQQLAYETAAEWFGHALSLMPLTHPDRLRSALDLGRAEGRAGHAAGARVAFEQAWQQASREGQTVLLAEAALGLGDVVVSAGTVDAGLVRMLERTLDRTRDRYPTLTIRLTARLATELYWGGGLERARGLARRAIELARADADPHALAAALAAYQFVLRGPDELPARLAAGEELVGLAARLDDEAVELQARRLLVPDRLQVDAVAADRELEAIRVLASESRLPLAQWYVMLYRSIRATMSGDVTNAATLIEDAEALGLRLEVQPAVVYAAGQRFALLRERGRVAESEREVRQSVARWPVLVTFQCMLALLLADLGRHDEAMAALDALVADGCAPIPRDSLWLASVSLLAEAAAETDSREHAAALHDLLEPYAGRIVVQGVVAWWGAVDYYLARTATVLGRLDEAEAAFGAALRLHESWGATPFVARTLAGLAELLRHRDGPGDRAHADRLAAHAETLTTPAPHPRGAGSGVAGRVLSTVLFLDVVGSTGMVADLGDAAWASLRLRFLDLARSELARHGGTEIDVAGDGLLATFTGPARAIRCALAVHEDVAALGLEIRAGVHTGELECDDHGGIAGLTLHIGARVMGEAAPGEVLVSATVKDLVAGSGLAFTPKGVRALRGLPGRWPLFAAAQPPR